jgi:predicted PurR-regulated permease PerM
LTKTLKNRLFAHISSFSVGLVLTAVAIVDRSDQLRQYLPQDGSVTKILVLVLIIAVAVGYELAAYKRKQFQEQITDVQDQVQNILHQMEVNQLIAAVNGLYGRFMTSGDEYIDNEYTIKELAELVDTRERLKINSYTQGRIEFLCSKVFRN